MNRTSITILLSLFCASLANAQTVQRFQYEKMYNEDGPYWQLVGGEGVITLSRYRSTTGVRERTVQSPQGNYVIQDSRKEKRALIKNTSGVTLASFRNRATNPFDVYLPDGTLYDFRRNNSSQWRYVLNEREILVCTYKREAGKRILEYDIKDPQAAGLEQLILASHDLGIATIVNKQTSPYLWAITIVGAFVIAANNSRNSTYVP